MVRPLRSFGSTQVDFGGIYNPASATALICAIETGKSIIPNTNFLFFNSWENASASKVPGKKSTSLLVFRSSIPKIGFRISSVNKLESKDFTGCFLSIKFSSMLSAYQASLIRKWRVWFSAGGIPWSSFLMVPNWLISAKKLSGFSLFKDFTILLNELMLSCCSSTK